MDAARHIILGLVFIALGFAAFATNAQLDAVWRLGSVAAVGSIATAGSVAFFVLAFRRR
jgi:hypothetical protein